MKKIILLIFIVISMNILFAQAQDDPYVKTSTGITIGKLGLNKVGGTVLQGTTAIDSLAWIVGEGGTLSLRIADTYPVLYSLKKLYSTASDTCIMLQRTLNSDSAWFGFANGILDTATLRSWLDTNIVLNGYFNTGITSWSAWQGVVKWYNTDWNTIGRTNCLLDSATSTTGNAVSQGRAFQKNKTYKIVFLYYIPSSNTTCVKIKPRFLGGSNPFLTAQDVTDVWTEVVIYHTALADYTWFEFYQTDVSGSANNTTIGDKIYIDNIRITETTPSGRKWFDQSGNGNHAVQLTSANQPIYNDSLAIKFDGVDDYMTANIGTYSQPNTFVMNGLFRYGSNRYVFDGIGNNNIFGVLWGSEWAMYADNYLGTSSNNSNCNLIAAVFNGASSFNIIDGVTTTGNAGTGNNGTGIMISCDKVGTDKFGRHDFKSFIMSQYGLTETQCNTITTYLNQ